MKRRRDPTTDPAGASEPRPETIIDWLVCLALWPVVRVAWLVAVPFVPLYVAVGFTLEVLFGIRLRRSDDADGPEPPGWGFDQRQPYQQASNFGSLNLTVPFQRSCRLSDAAGELQRSASASKRTCNARTYTSACYTSYISRAPE